MKGPIVAASVVGAGVAATVVRQVVNRAKTPAAGDAGRWLAVTVNLPPEEVRPDGRLPQPLADLGDAVDVRVDAAPGDKGTEIRVRPRPTAEGGAGDDQEQRRRIRSALRESKQLLEVGEVLKVDPAPHGHRKPTPAGRVLEWATRRAPEEGLL